MTPIRCIITFAQSLSDILLNEKYKHLAEMIIATGKILAS